MPFTADHSQQIIIEAQTGQHLVLAPPGCGKTFILAQRIRYAIEQGVSPSDMLCLTFTNRAARSMKERVYDLLNTETPSTAITGLDPSASPTPFSSLFIGNIHRYCSRFLFENALLPAESSVIDEDDVISIMARFMDEDENYVASNYNRRRQYYASMQLSAMMKQIELQHPRELRIHPECLSAEDVTAIRRLCEFAGKQFSAEGMADIYHHTDQYHTLVYANDDNDRQDALLYAERKMITAMLRKMQLACQYDDYKRDNNLLDFEDLLILTFDALYNDKSINGHRQYHRYRWVQIDEVQDLNPLQMAIVDQLIDVPDASIMYLGDEQQAIFSFMGAKLSTLNILRERCGENVHSLSVNHRSPDYMLRVFNTYAEHVLHIDPKLLPHTDYSPLRIGNELLIIASNTHDVEYLDVSQQAERLYHQHPEETTAVIVSSNADADMISERMQYLNLPHFKISGTDVFSLPETKLLFSHLAVLANEGNFMAWSRLLKGLRVYEQNAAARRFVRGMMDAAICMSDVLLYDKSTYVQEFVGTYEKRDIIIFDTETTGLDVYNDDIVQIAALRLRKGKVVPGSEFKVFIKTQREIPLMLGDVVNPIIEEMNHHTLYQHAEALRMFIEYVDDGVLLGHNADFDYNILRNNILRYLPSLDFHTLFPEYFDSLKITRLLLPELHQYKLKHLLEVLHLEGENSHLADADVDATKNVVVYCYSKAKDIIARQKEVLSNKAVRDRIEALRRNYQQLYLESRGLLWEKSQEPDRESLLIAEMQRFYQHLQQLDRSYQVPNIGYILSYIDGDIIDKTIEISLRQQIEAHNQEISTLREADLCGSGTIKERVFVSTIHKAKGLEFDNVIVFDAVEGRFPNFYSQNDPQQIAEDARKFYVAMTRARKRLAISMAEIRHDYRNNIHTQSITRFMTPLMKLFTEAAYDCALGGTEKVL